MTLIQLVKNFWQKNNRKLNKIETRVNNQISQNLADSRNPAHPQWNLADLRSWPSCRLV